MAEPAHPTPVAAGATAVADRGLTPLGICLPPCPHCRGWLMRQECQSYERLGVLGAETVLREYACMACATQYVLVRVAQGLTLRPLTRDPAPDERRPTRHGAW
jgi:hypothetical protein